MDGTIILQGQFTSTGAATFIPLRSGVDWMEVINMTEAAAANASHGVSYDWQLGMANNDGLVTLRNAAATEVNIDTSAGLAVDGFQLLDTSVQTTGANRAVTNISGAAIPVVSAANTTGLIANETIVRMYFQTTAGAGLLANQLAGIDFTVGVVNAGADFQLQNMAQIVGTDAVIASNYRVIPFNPIFYPRRRVISKITQAVQAVVTTTVNHGYIPGQQIRFSNVRQVRAGAAAYGMVEIDGLVGNIVDTTASTFTVDIDTTGFTAFVFPLTANYPFTPALAIPVGEDTATALDLGEDILSDATINTAEIGMLLGAGITSPAGTVGQSIFWKAGKSFNV